MAEEVTRNLPVGDKRSDVLAFQATVYIPVGLTLVCSSLDILSRWQLLGVNILNDEFIVNTVLSYFFPTIFAAALGMMWIHFFGAGISGIKDGFEVRFSLWTAGLFLVYLINLFLIRFHWAPYEFLIFIGVYVYVSLKRYLDFSLLKYIGLEKDKPDIERASGGSDE